ncbi:MAG: hypothetical protein U9M98_03935, partial [Patescibacteria group bacterium]|nr:hypothetical protein [Patescibacteria group bacterium]
LEGWGYTEVKTTSFTNESELRNANLELKNTLRVQNPLTEDATLLRPSLVPKLLRIYSQNQKWHKNPAIFQLSRTFTSSKNNKLPTESWKLAGLRTGKDEESSFYQLKGTVEALLAKLGVENTKFKPLTEESPFWKQNASAKILAGNEELLEVGQLGIIKKTVQENFKIEKGIAGFDLEVNNLLENARKFKTYQPISPHPPVIEDLTFEVGERSLVGNIKKTIEKLANQDYQTEVTAKTIYQDNSLKKQEKKRITFTLEYNSEKGSLSDKDIRPLRKKIVKTVKEKFEAELTGSV